MIGKLFGRKDDKSTGKPPDQESFGLKIASESGETCTFEALPFTIGRSEDNDLSLNDETVSARHARLYYDSRVPGVCIEDLESLNGISINGLPTRKNVLQDGVKIGLGSVILTYWDTGYIHPSS